MASKLKKGLGTFAQFALPIAGALTGNPGLAAAGGALGGALSGKKGALKQAGIGAAAGYGGTKLLQGFGGGGQNPLANFSLGGLLGGGGGGINTSSGQGVKYSTSGGVSGKGLTKPLGGDGFGIMEMFKNPNVLGIGSLALGLGKQFPKAPELPPSVDEARNAIRGGGSPLGQFSQGKLQELMGQNYDALSQPEIDASLRQLELEQKRAEDQVRDLYRNLRPGTDPSTDTAFRRDLMEVQDQFSRAKADTVATRTRDTKTAFDQQRLQQIQLALGASNQDMQNLIQLAQFDVNQIAAQLNLDVEQAKLFKNTFIDLGASLLTPESPFEKFLAANT